MRKKATSPSSVYRCTVLDGNEPWCQPRAEEAGLEEERASGCSNAALTHKALIAREEAEQAELQNLAPQWSEILPAVLVTYLWSQRKHQLVLLGPAQDGEVGGLQR